jgi:hypothetical protein
MRTSSEAAGTCSGRSTAASQPPMHMQEPQQTPSTTCQLAPQEQALHQQGPQGPSPTWACQDLGPWHQQYYQPMAMQQWR